DRGRCDLIQRVPGLLIQFRPGLEVMPCAERRPRTAEHAVLDHARLMPFQMPPHHVPVTGQFPPERDRSEPTVLPLRDRRVHVMLREEQATLPVDHQRRYVPPSADCIVAERLNRCTALSDMNMSFRTRDRRGESSIMNVGRSPN